MSSDNSAADSAEGRREKYLNGLPARFEAEYKQALQQAMQTHFNAVQQAQQHYEIEEQRAKQLITDQHQLLKREWASFHAEKQAAAKSVAQSDMSPRVFVATQLRSNGKSMAALEKSSLTSNETVEKILESMTLVMHMMKYNKEVSMTPSEWHKEFFFEGAFGWTEDMFKAFIARFPDFKQESQ
jgi:hypothetical protein